MFGNSRVYEHILIILDGNGATSTLSEIETMKARALLVFPRENTATFVTDYNILHLIAPEDILKLPGSQRGSGYAKQLLVKMLLDKACHTIANKYKIAPPDIISIIDADSYFQTFITPEAVYHTTPAIHDSSHPEYALIVHSLFHATVQLPALWSGMTQWILGSFVLTDNCMVGFPVPVWRTDFELVRETIRHDKIKANEIQAGANTSWMDVFQKVTTMFCEFCVLLNIAAVQNSKGYLLTRETRWQNPIVHTMVHNKERFARNHRTISKGCCLSFNLTTHARCRAHMVGLDKIVCMNNSTMSCMEVLTPGDHIELARTDNI